MKNIIKQYGIIFLTCCIYTNTYSSLFDRDLDKSNSPEHYRREFKIIKLSASVLQQTIEALLNKNYQFFDGTVKDNKCQTRASMMLDMKQEFQQQQANLQNMLPVVQAIKQKAEGFLLSLSAQTEIVRRTIREIQGAPSLSQFFIDNGLVYIPSPILKTAAQCFITNKENKVFAGTDLSKTIINDLRDQCQNQLCDKSIVYEQALARDCAADVQDAMAYVASNDHARMTAFFPSMIALLTNMKKQKHSIQLIKEIFCPGCGQLERTTIHNFSSETGTFQPVKTLPADEPCLIVEGYQYPKSLDALKLALEIDPAATEIPNDKKKGTCEYPLEISQPPIPDDIETVLLNNAAQHTQYITKEAIPFNEKSRALEQDFLRRTQSNGFGISNMAVFSVNHIYAAKPRIR